MANQKKKKVTSHQWKWQQEQEAKGMCRICGRPLFSKNYCFDHAVNARERQRDKLGCVRRNTNTALYKRGKHEQEQEDESNEI